MDRHRTTMKKKSNVFFSNQRITQNENTNWNYSSDMPYTYNSSMDCQVNKTETERSPQYDIGFRVYYGTFVLTIALVCLTGNLMVIRYILKRKRSHLSACSYMIFSLACSDTSMGLIYPLYNLFQILDLDRGRMFLFPLNLI